MKQTITLFLILLLAASYSVYANEVQIVGTVDKNRAAIDEEISFTIRVLGAKGNLQAPRLPIFNGFDSFYTGRTSHFTFINGKSSATVEFSYVLVPKVAGRFTLQPVQMWIDGKNYSTPPLELEVIGPQVPVSAPGRSGQPPLGYRVPHSPQAPAQASPAPQMPPSAAPQVIHDENVFVKAAVDKQTIFPNEQVLLTYTLYTRYDTRFEGFEEEPSVSGFWIEDFPLDRDLGQEYVNVNGRRYMKADVRKIALFPTAAADYTIQPGVLKVSVREDPRNSTLFDEFFGDSFFSGSSFFARRSERLLKPEPITIKVRPFPEEGKPASFNGAVGQFRMEAVIDKNQIKQNEPVTLTLTLEGSGNIETLSRPPIPDLTGFKMYDGDSSSQLQKQGTTLGGKKTFEVIFIPTESGAMAIPPLEFSFFNSQLQTYQVLRSPAFPLQVTPSDEPLRLPAELAQKDAFKKEILRESQDVRYIHEEIPSDAPARIQRLLFLALTLGNLLGLGLVVSGLWRNRQEAIFSQNLGLKRRKLARPVALRRMKALKRLASSQKEEGAHRFIEEAEKILSDYLANKFNVSSYDFTERWIEEELTEVLTPEDSLLKEIRRFYMVSRETRFGRGGLPAEERRQILLLIEKVIHRVERLK